MLGKTGRDAAADPGSKLTLVVEDDGQGIVDGSSPKGTGLGQVVISAMAKSLGSRVEFDPSHRGTRAVLAFQV